MKYYGYNAQNTPMLNDDQRTEVTNLIEKACGDDFNIRSAGIQFIAYIGAFVLFHDELQWKWDGLRDSMYEAFDECEKYRIDDWIRYGNFAFLTIIPDYDYWIRS